MSTNNWNPRAEFVGDDLDFIAGSIKGLRSWNMDKLGRLHGVTHREVWRPGINESKCFKTVEIQCPALVPPEKPKSLGDEAVRSKSKPKRWRVKDHQVAFEDALARMQTTVAVHDTRAAKCEDPSCMYGVHRVPTKHDFDTSCDCGFWAYDEAGFTSHGRVAGVIEGFGKTTVGTKGFRCEKARIVAFIRYADDDADELTFSEQHRLTQLYPDAVWFDGLEDAVKFFPEVMRDWPEVTEDFWDTPVPRPRDSFASWQMQYSRLLGYSPSSPSAARLFGGITS